MRLSVFIVVVCIALTSGACLKQSSYRFDPCGLVATAPEDQEIVAFLAANRPGVTATKHCSGMYYRILEPGTGATPTYNSIVSAYYVGKFKDGRGFDSSVVTPAAFPLDGVIRGWQVSIPLIKEGGRIEMFIPPTLAYGTRGAGTTIPPNTMLVFDVTLVAVR